MPIPNLDGTDQFDTVETVIDQTIDKVNEIDAGLPGGTSGQVLKKSSSTDYDYEWSDESVTPIESWTSVDVSGGDILSGTVKYRKDNNGHVFLMGNFAFDSSVGSTSATLLTLPVGYRPAQIVSFACTDRSIGGAKDVVAITINTTGVVSWITQSGSTFNSRTIHVDGINFFID